MTSQEINRKEKGTILVPNKLVSELGEKINLAVGKKKPSSIEWNRDSKKGNKILNYRLDIIPNDTYILVKESYIISDKKISSKTTTKKSKTSKEESDDIPDIDSLTKEQKNKLVKKLLEI